MFFVCVCVTQWPPDTYWIWTGPRKDVGRSSSCRPALWWVNNDTTSQLAGGWIQRRNRLRRCWDLPWSLLSPLRDSWPLPPSWSPFSVFVTAPLITPAGLLHSKSAEPTCCTSICPYLNLPQARFCGNTVSDSVLLHIPLDLFYCIYLKFILFKIVFSKSLNRFLTDHIKYDCVSQRNIALISHIL